MPSHLQSQQYCGPSSPSQTLKSLSLPPLLPVRESSLFRDYLVLLIYKTRNNKLPRDRWETQEGCISFATVGVIICNCRSKWQWVVTEWQWTGIKRWGFKSWLKDHASGSSRHFFEPWLPHLWNEIATLLGSACFSSTSFSLLLMCFHCAFPWQTFPINHPLFPTVPGCNPRILLTWPSRKPLPVHWSWQWRWSMSSWPLEVLFHPEMAQFSQMRNYHLLWPNCWHSEKSQLAGALLFIYIWEAGSFFKPQIEVCRKSHFLSL